MRKLRAKPIKVVEKKRGRRKIEPSDRPAPVLISRRDAASLLGVGEQVLKRMEDNGLLQGIRLNAIYENSGSPVLYRIKDIENIIAGNVPPKGTVARKRLVKEAV